MPAASTEAISRRLDAAAARLAAGGAAEEAAACAKLRKKMGAKMNDDDARAKIEKKLTKLERKAGSFPDVGAAAGAKPTKSAKRRAAKKQRLADAPADAAAAPAAAAPAAAAAEDVPLWDFDRATAKGLAPPPLRAAPKAAAAAVQLEVRRAKALNRLREALRVAVHPVPVPPLAFERWRAATALAEEVAAKAAAPAAGPGKKRKRAEAAAAGADAVDAVLPGGKAVTDGGALAAELAAAGVAGAEGVVATLQASSSKEAVNVAALAHALESGKAPQAEVAVRFNKRSVDLSVGKAFVTVTRPAYAKLVVLHRLHGAEAERAPDPGDNGFALDEAAAAEADAAKGHPVGGVAYAAFHARLFALLLRYKALQAPEHQASLAPAVQKALHDRFGAALETFASPLNCYARRFGSAFPDTDAPFGSAGSFFDLPLPRGSYGVAPPPGPEPVLAAAAARCAAALEAAEAAGEALRLTVVVPAGGGAAWAATKKFEAFKAKVAKAEHRVVDGSSHQVQLPPFRTDDHDAVVTVLQSSKAASKWPFETASCERALRKAMMAGK